MVLAWFLYGFMLSPGQVLASPMSSHAAIPVEIVQVGDSYQLLRDGKPYAIRGAGMDTNKVALLAAQGGNSLRTWGSGVGELSGKQLLDEAHRYGITVALCLDLARERHGFDYDDEAAVARQFEYARQEVMKYKDHPALLFWIIGNELNHSYSNPRVFDAINDISEMIHELDGKHPTTTAFSGFSGDLIATTEARAPDLDFLSFQLYGALDELPEQLESIGYTRPFMVTEWGSTGHWEVSTTDWGAPIEMNSSDKARHFLNRHQAVIATRPGQIIGSYVFLFGQKQERTPTWYGMLLEDGSRTESIDVMHYIWNGAWPENRAPAVRGMLLDGRSAQQSAVLAPGGQYDAAVDVEGAGELSYRWLVMRESDATQQGGDAEEVPDVVPAGLEDTEGSAVSMVAPMEPGAYRLFVYIHNDHGQAGHANIPFLVDNSLN